MIDAPIADVSGIEVATPTLARKKAIRRSTAQRAILAGGWLFVAAVVGGIAISYFWPQIAPTRMLIFAHHGDITRWPENSLEGLNATIDLRPDGIEFDVRRSKDGTFWLQHREFVDIATTGTGRIADLRDDELAKLTVDAGPGVAPGQGVIHLATMEAALTALKAFDGWVMVDLKDDDTEEHGELARTLLRSIEPDRVLILSCNRPLVPGP